LAKFSEEEFNNPKDLKMQISFLLEEVRVELLNLNLAKLKKITHYL